MRPLPVLATAAVLLLSGCGVAGTDFRPGVAATVGDTTLTTSHVDEVTSRFCTAVEEQITASGQRLPLRYLRFGIAGELVVRAAAEQLAEDYDVSPGVQYRQSVAQLRTQTADLDDEVSDAVVEVSGASAYITDVLTSIGAILLEREGASDPTTEEQVQAGEEALSEWFDSNDVVVDPRYGIALEDGRPRPADTDLSYPVGETAKNGLLAEPDPDYANGLPAHLACG